MTLYIIITLFLIQKRKRSVLGVTITPTINKSMRSTTLAISVCIYVINRKGHEPNQNSEMHEVIEDVR